MALPVSLAGPGSRGLAWLVDLVLRLVIVALASVVFALGGMDLEGGYGLGTLYILLFLLDWSWHVFWEVLDDGRVGSSVPPKHDFAGPFVGKGGIVATGAARRVVGVDQVHDSPGQGDGVAAQSFRVATAVPVFVVGQRNRPRHLQKGGTAALEERGADARVAAHHFPLLGVQRSWLLQYGVRHPGLAAVVDGRRFEEHLGVLGRPARRQRQTS